MAQNGKDTKPPVMLFDDVKLTVAQLLVIITIVGGAFAGYANLATEFSHLKERVEELADAQKEVLREFQEFRKETQDELRKL